MKRAVPETRNGIPTTIGEEPPQRASVRTVITHSGQRLRRTTVPPNISLTHGPGGHAPWVRRTMEVGQLSTMKLAGVCPIQGPIWAAVNAAKRHLGKPTLGRALRPFMRRLSPLDRLQFFEWLYDQWKDQGGKYPFPLPNPAAGWVRGGRCRTLRTNGFQIATSNSMGAAHAWNNNANNCLGGQAASPDPIGTQPTSVQRQLNYLRNTNGKSGSLARYAHTDAFWRPSTGTPPQPSFVPGWTLGVDPNTMRWWPAMPQPWEPGIPDVAPGSGQPPSPSLPQPFHTPSSPYDPDSAWRWSTDPATGTLTSPVYRNPVKDRTKTQSPDREGKVMTRMRRVAIALYKALDEISEWAEVVDAVYDALPDDVKKRWDRDERQGDNFGQYGIDGADWKLQAIYWNFHRLDREQAIKNIIKNHLSDKVIGSMQRKLPKNTGAAHEGGEMEFAQWLDGVFSESLGL